MLKKVKMLKENGQNRNPPIKDLEINQTDIRIVDAPEGQSESLR